MENLIIFIIFIIFSVLRSLAERRQNAGQRPGGRPAGLPIPPVFRPARPPLRPESLAPEYLEGFFAAEAMNKEKGAETWQPTGQTVSEPAKKYGVELNQAKLFQPNQTALLQGIVYAEVLGLPRVKKPWQYKK